MSAVAPAEIVTVAPRNGSATSSSSSSSSRSRVSVEINPRPAQPPPPPAVPPPPPTTAVSISNNNNNVNDDEVKVVSGKWSSYVGHRMSVDEEDGKSSGSNSNSSGSNNHNGSGVLPGVDADSPEPILPGPPALVQRSPGGRERRIDPDHPDRVFLDSGYEKTF